MKARDDSSLAAPSTPLPPLPSSSRRHPSRQKLTKTSGPTPSRTRLFLSCLPWHGTQPRHPPRHLTTMHSQTKGGHGGLVHQCTNSTIAQKLELDTIPPATARPPPHCPILPCWLIDTWCFFLTHCCIPHAGLANSPVGQILSSFPTQIHRPHHACNVACSTLTPTPCALASMRGLPHALHCQRSSVQCVSYQFGQSAQSHVPCSDVRVTTCRLLNACGSGDGSGPALPFRKGDAAISMRRVH